MKINVTKKQYIILKEMCLLGAYIIEESKIIEDEEYSEFLKYILSAGGDLSDTLKNNIIEAMDEVASTIIKEVEFKGDFLANYNERIFWKELASRMATRDAIELIGEEIGTKNYKEFVSKKNNLEKKYFAKFEKSNYSNKELPY